MSRFHDRSRFSTTRGSSLNTLFAGSATRPKVTAFTLVSINILPDSFNGRRDSHSWFGKKVKKR